jgi:hypothetical protein
MWRRPQQRTAELRNHADRRFRARLLADPNSRASMPLKRIEYSRLKAKQKENFNFQKISAVLADYGFVTLRLSDDWQGADFIAQHVDGATFLRIQLKSRLTFDAKYQGKNLWIVFYDGEVWYLYPHDKFLAEVLRATGIGKTTSWSKRGRYSFPHLSVKIRHLLSRYRISGDLRPVPE